MWILCTVKIISEINNGDKHELATSYLWPKPTLDNAPLDFLAKKT